MSSNSEIPYHDLGSTGERVSVIGVGGWHLALPQVDEKLALRRCLRRPFFDSPIRQTPEGKLCS
jgi:hypothetical protein